MSTVQDLVQCPQCEFPEAALLFHSRDQSVWVHCPCCGFTEEEGPVYGQDESVSEWRTETRRGFGSMVYQPVHTEIFSVHHLDNSEDVVDAEKWLQKAIVDGAVRPQTAYLTRWNDEKQRVEVVFGEIDRLRSWCDPPANPEAVNSWKARQST